MALLPASNYPVGDSPFVRQLTSAFFVTLRMAVALTAQVALFKHQCDERSLPAGWPEKLDVEIR